MTLAAELQAVTDSFVKQAPQAVLVTMTAAAQRLASINVAQRALQAGAQMPDFELPDANGAMVSSAKLRAQGPLAISFYRGAWCPYCNLELKALQERLPAIRDKGATLIAISPQTPDYSLITRDKLELTFPVLSDVGNRVARQFGLVFKLEDSLKPIYKDVFGIDLPAHNGDQQYELPLAATYVVSRSGKIVDAFIDTDYSKRLEPEAVLEWLDRAGTK